MQIKCQFFCGLSYSMLQLIFFLNHHILTPFDSPFHFSQSFKILAYVINTNIVVRFLLVKMLKYGFLLC